MDARVTQEAAGPGRFRLGFGASRIFMKEIGAEDVKPLNPARDSVRIVRGVLGGEPFDYDGPAFSAHVPGPRRGRADPARRACRSTSPAPARGCRSTPARRPTACSPPRSRRPAFVRYSRENMATGAAKTGRDPAEIDLGCTIVASIDHDRDRGREGAREIAGMYLANKVQNIQGSADVLLELAGLSQAQIAPIADAMERGGRLAAAAAVTRRDPRPLRADRRHARPTASPRSRPTARPAART